MSIEEDSQDSLYRPQEEVSERLETWLTKSDWRVEELENWLLGYYLPPVGHTDPPYVWIYRGLVLAEQRGKAEFEMALRLAGLLRTFAVSHEKASNVLRNLLSLCSCITSSDILGEPLWELCQSYMNSNEELDPELRIALTSAVISNQSDKRFLPIWLRMIEGGEDSLFLGSPKFGLDGVALMPGGESNASEPSLPEIGNALTLIAKTLRPEHDRRTCLSQYIDEIVKTYPDQEDWEKELLQMADQHSWPDWALVSLPSLCVPWSKDVQNENNRVLIWEVYLPIVKELGFDSMIENSLCENRILQLSISGQALSVVEPLACCLEQSRKQNPFPTYSAVVGSITDTMSVMEKVFINQPESTKNATVNQCELEVTPFVNLMEQQDIKVSPKAIADARRTILSKNRAGVIAATNGG